MARSRRTSAVLILPMLLGPFRPLKPAPGGPATVFLWGREQGLLVSGYGRRLMGLRPGLGSARPVQIRSFSWPNWTAPEAFTDPKRLGKRLSNEGHGFSRAVKGLRG
jgi:hypothetical protein